ncbi:hypothetical protein D3C80_908890 [compost metagenome]
MTDHIIYLWIFNFTNLGQRQIQPIMPFGKIKSLPDTGQHPQCQYIYFEETQCLQIIFVPLQVGSVIHAGIYQGTELVQITLCNNKTTGMLPQLPWKPDILMRQFEYLTQMRIVGIKALFLQALQINIIIPMTADHARQTADSIHG